MPSLVGDDLRHRKLRHHKAGIEEVRGQWGEEAAAAHLALVTVFSPLTTIGFVGLEVQTGEARFVVEEADEELGAIPAQFAAVYQTAMEMAETKLKKNGLTEGKHFTFCLVIKLRASSR